MSKDKKIFREYRITKASDIRVIDHSEPEPKDISENYQTVARDYGEMLIDAYIEISKTDKSYSLSRYFNELDEHSIGSHRILMELIRDDIKKGVFK